MIFMLILIAGLSVGNFVMAAPTVTTNTAVPSSTSADLNGTYNDNGQGAVDAWFEWGPTNALGTFTALTNIGTGSSISHTANITGLTPSTTYYYRASGMNSSVANGAIVSFTTTASGGSAPIVTTTTATPSSTSAVVNGTYNENGTGLSTTTFFEYGPTTSYGFTTANVNQGTGSGTATVTITGLASNSAYYFRIVGQNTNGTSYGSPVSFSTTSGGGSVPTLTTTSASSIGQSSATLNGTYNSNGLASSVRFEWGTTSGTYPNTTTLTSVGTGSGSHNATISGLTAGTTYYYRIIGSNSAGSAQGSQISFTTTTSGGSVPTLTTTSASSIGQTYATLNGTYNGNGLSASVQFEWGTTSGTYPNTTTLTSVGTGSGSHNATISGLTAGTTYYYRIIGSNSAGSAQGSQISFTTTTSGGGNVPIITTTSVSGVGQTYATLNGTYNDNGTGLNTTVYFQYGTSSSNLNSTTGSTTYSSSSDIFNNNISSLSSGTTYYFRAVGNNSNGTAYGSILSFFVPTSGGGSAPSITTNSASGITNSSAVLNGYYNANNDNTTTYFRYGTSSSNLNQNTASVSQGNGSGIFSNAISNLNNNTTYYFQAVGWNSNGYTNGTILNFTTGSGNGNGLIPTVETTIATLTADTTTRLNGLVISTGAVSTNVWFEWGSAISLGKTTAVQSIGSGTNISFNDSLSGLNTNSIYYFRLVGQNQYGIDYGEIRIFRTQGSGYIEVPISNSPNSLVSLEIETSYEDIFVGDSLTYIITYTNTSNKSLKNVILRVALPNEIEFSRSDEGRFSESSHELSINLGTLAPYEKDSLRVRGDVLNTAKGKEILVTTAALVYTDSSSNIQNEVIAYILNYVLENKGNGGLVAGLFGTDGFFPSSLFSWLLLILVILGIVYVGRMVYDRESPAFAVRKQNNNSNNRNTNISDNEFNAYNEYKRSQMYYNSQNSFPKSESGQGGPPSFLRENI